MTAAAAGNFKSLCRHWRQYRKLSQLDLALAANVSQRHVSWLETGRSQPSREMVVRLSEAMEIPLRERNSLLQAAGYSAAYSESSLEEPGMAPVLEALKSMLGHHQPFPAVVVDRFWNVKLKNPAADLLLNLAGDLNDVLAATGSAGEINLALLTLHPQGLRPFISNWELAAPAFVRRLRGEALASGDPEVQDRFAAYIELAGLEEGELPITESLLPILPLQARVGDLELSLFTIVSTIGTAQDITADELRLEAFYPADETTENFFRGVA